MRTIATFAVGFIVGLFVTVLPQQYRRWWPQSERDLLGPAIGSGVLQMTLGLGGLVASFVIFMDQRLASILSVTGPTADRAVLGGVGLVSMAEFVFRPMTILIVYILVEGIVRVASAFVSGEVCGNLALHGIGAIHMALVPGFVERAMGPRVPDRVKAVEGKVYDLLVASCRRKPTWDRLITIRYQDELYEVLKEVRAQPPHRFMYELRKNPSGRVTRRIHDYDPNEALTNAHTEVPNHA